MIYSTDASIYQIVPQAVAFPKSDEDLQIIMEYAFANNIPITPRGGGTSLAGATVGSGIIVDFSMFMNKVLILLMENIIAIKNCAVLYWPRKTFLTKLILEII